MQRKSTPLSHPFHVLFWRPLHVLMVCLVLPLAVAGNVLFHIECPPDVTIDCNDELWDLSIYGNATIYGYGDPQPAGPPISVDYDLNSCNTGTIIRTWVAYDYGGNPYYCSQTITVGGTGGYTNIYWPPDYVIHSCNPETDPEDLPPPYDFPVFNDDGECSQLLTNYEDLVFNINPPACRKILRKWTVVDWCVYDPNDWDPQGIWTHTQVIKIAPENPPVIWCPPDTIVSAGADCTGGHVTLPPAYGMSDCGAGVIITNHSPYAYHHGADASGNYPLGTTKVTFTADDGCGQKTSCSMYVTVKDLKKPTPICYYGITISLMQMPDGYYMDLRPSFFNKGSFDNCTPKHALKMWVEPSRVGCAELGATPVRLYVEDASGNVEYCNTLVYVQDNNGICPPDDGIVDGTIFNPAGNALEEVKVSVQSTSIYSMTNSDGAYAFAALPFGTSYTITPAYPEDDLSGVTTIDMVAVLKHILGSEPLSSPYQFIAADMDRSGRVSVSDLLTLKELVLQEYYGLHPKTSWRFVDATYTFINASDPLSEPFPESYEIPVLTGNMNDLDFVGIKLGDINSDATTNLQQTTPIEIRNASVPITLPELQFKKGESHEVWMNIAAYRELEAMQFGLEAKNDLIEVTGVKPVSPVHGLDIINGLQEHGVITALWYGVESLTSPQLFQINFHAMKNGKLSDALSLHSGSHAIVYRKGNETPFDISLQFGDAGAVSWPSAVNQNSTLIVRQNYPNPFSRTTTIPVELAEEGILEIEVLSLDGRCLYRTEQEGTVGIQEIVIQSNDVGATGILFCRVTMGGATQTIRMMLRPGA